MNFRFGDKVSYGDNFAVYKGKITGHREKTDWPFFWRTAHWYLISLTSVNGEYAYGMLSVIEKEISLDSPTSNEPTAKVVPLNKKD